MFLPTTRREMEKLGWEQPDIVLVTGDTYIDSPFIGIAVIGRILYNAGYRVAIIAQPDVNSGRDITRLGEPSLFWGVSGGSIDSMVANYTAGKKRRKSDDYTPGGINNRRPDRAVMVYTNLIRRYYKNTQPIVLGGIEASLRRIAHYDFWSDRVRRSILFDAKADLLVYGMAERTILNLADQLKNGRPAPDIPGICYISREKKEGYLELPTYEQVVQDKQRFTEMFHTFYHNQEPLTARGLVQQHGDRFLIHNPPAAYQTQQELDAVYAMDFERDVHPAYAKEGKVKALDTIRFSIPTHRGCYGECNFCSIAVHEGRTVRWRGEQSILREAEKLTHLPGFTGYIRDVGGPTANMYGFECTKKLKSGACRYKRCLYPAVCDQLKTDHSRQLSLLKKLRSIPGVKKVFVASGIRYDMIFDDRTAGDKYLREIVEHHISGQMKIAPEHINQRVLQMMGKPGSDSLIRFKNSFYKYTRETGKKQFLTYYLIAAHPGCTEEDMKELKHFASTELKVTPEQVQIFTPLPSTYSALMYYTETDPFSGKSVFVEKDNNKKERQKQVIVGSNRRRR